MYMQYHERYPKLKLWGANSVLILALLNLKRLVLLLDYVINVSFHRQIC